MMDPLIGRTLSHYRVEERLGSGGMGVVYRARDLILGRDVAIKVLAKPFVKDPARLSRLLREAKLLATLNHPSIAAIYGLERPKRGSPFLILEYIRGESLADLLREGPLPIPEALRVCGEIAGALEAAHKRGVIHRDIKPGNVMLTSGGAVKVLDFGLARRAPDDGVESGTTSDVSVPGIIMGTPGYISPEQILSQPHDRRVDVFGFGCVLYECLTARRAFSGESVSDRLYAAVSRDPDWGALPVDTPEPLRRLLARCLERDPGRRLAEAREARAEIEALTGPLRGRPLSGGAATGPHNLPDLLTSFVGREHQVQECMELMRQCRLLTLTGSGGCGKTRLALKLAETLHGTFPDGAWLVDLAPLADPTRVALTIASTLSIREEAETPLLTTLAERLSGKRMLLVLDNCEHVLASCASVARDLLERCRDIVILATSREPMHVGGERAYPVPAMVVPGPHMTLRELESVESVRLFVDRARALVPQFTLSSRSVPAVAEICRRVDGIPLAVELAAARVKLLSPEEILEMLGDRFRLLVGGSASSRHQTLAATFEWSYSQLDDGERRLFRSLAVFSGGWNLEGATAVAGPGSDRLDVMERMTRLVDKSLVIAERSPSGETRCRYLETIREYALDRLREEHEQEEARARHLVHYLDLAQRAAPELVGASQAEWLARLEADHENLLSALASCAGSEAADEAGLRLGAAVWRFWLGHGHFAIGRRILEEILQRPGSRDPSRTRAEALLGAGALAFHQNDWLVGRAHFEESLEISQTIGYPEGVGHALVGLANLCLGQGDYEGAKPLYRRAKAVYEDVGHNRGVGLALSNLGRVAELQGDLEAAWDLYQQGIDIFRDSGDVASIALRLSSLGDLSLRLGRRDAARHQLLESLALIQELQERRAGAYALARSAALAVQEQRLHEAAILYGASDALRRRIGPVMTPRELAEHQSREGQARAEYGLERFEADWSVGQALSFTDAISFALTSLTETKMYATDADPGHRNP